MDLLDDNSDDDDDDDDDDDADDSLISFSWDCMLVLRWYDYSHDDNTTSLLLLYYMLSILYVVNLLCRWVTVVDNNNID